MVTARRGATSRLPPLRRQQAGRRRAAHLFLCAGHLPHSRRSLSSRADSLHRTARQRICGGAVRLGTCGGRRRHSGEARMARRRWHRSSGFRAVVRCNVKKEESEGNFTLVLIQGHPTHFCPKSNTILNRPGSLGTKKSNKRMSPGDPGSSARSRRAHTSNTPFLSPRRAATPFTSLQSGRATSGTLRCGLRGDHPHPTFLVYAASGSVASEVDYANSSTRRTSPTLQPAAVRHQRHWEGRVAHATARCSAAASSGTRATPARPRCQPLVMYTDAKHYAAGKACLPGWTVDIMVPSAPKHRGEDGLWFRASDDMPGITALPCVCLLFLSIIHIQIHTHLKWGGYGI
jgi:hypothetical protein